MRIHVGPGNGMGDGSSDSLVIEIHVVSYGQGREGMGGGGSGKRRERKGAGAGKASRQVGLSVSILLFGPYWQKHRRAIPDPRLLSLFLLPRAQQKPSLAQYSNRRVGGEENKTCNRTGKKAERIPTHSDLEPVSAPCPCLSAQLPPAFKALSYWRCRL